MMALPEAKYSGGKILPHSDLRVGSVSGGVIKSELFKIGAWNVRTLRRAGKLENLKVEMDKCGISIMGLSEVRWTGQGETVFGNYTMF
ncbi:hypothetical protein, partial [Streptococcus anginosus]|uniref:hypothetical protein n=1 Tax=Streptococcus anginosus TaxID=1328 RepID=UPI002ED9D2A4